MTITRELPKVHHGIKVKGVQVQHQRQPLVRAVGAVKAMERGQIARRFGVTGRDIEGCREAWLDWLCVQQRGFFSIHEAEYEFKQSIRE